MLCQPIDRRLFLTGAVAALALPCLLANAAAMPTMDEVAADPAIPALGNPQGDVTIAEYVDFQCPVCKLAFIELKKLLAEDAGIRLVMKDWPIFGDASRYAAKMALATSDSGHYGQAVDALMTAEADAPAKDLNSKCKVKFKTIDLPIGLSATDRFIVALSNAADVDVPECVTEERGRLVDIITDMQQYFYNKRVALFGDPDQLIPLTELLVDLDMKPVYIVTGTTGKVFNKRITDILSDTVPDAKIKSGANADLFLLHQWIKNEPVDLIIGNTYGKYIARDEDIPFLRMGFPILDRTGHSYFPTVGYLGAMRILERMLDLLMDRQDRDSSEESFELVM